MRIYGLKYMKCRLQMMNTVNKMPEYVGSKNINQPQNVSNTSKIKCKDMCWSRYWVTTLSIINIWPLAGFLLLPFTTY